MVLGNIVKIKYRAVLTGYNTTGITAAIDWTVSPVVSVNEWMKMFWLNNSYVHIAPNKVYRQASLTCVLKWVFESICLVYVVARVVKYVDNGLVYAGATRQHMLQTFLLLCLWI